MRGQTVIVAALALLAALVAIVYGTMHTSPVPNQAGTQAPASTTAADRQGLPPNARTEAPGEPRRSPPLPNGPATTGSGETPAQPGEGR